MIADLNSFLAGVQVGLRLKTWEADAVISPVPVEQFIVTQDDDDIITEDGDELITE